MEKNLVSIIIPTYNRAEMIGETLDYILAQGYRNWECIVVDDGSTDYTSELMEFFCKQDSRIQYYHRPLHKLSGGNAARNYGLELSKGEFINWVDSDDLMLANKLQDHINVLKRREICCTVSEGVFSDKTTWGTGCTKGSPFDALIQQKDRWPVNSVIWRKSYIQNFRWNENLKGGQEWEFHLRATYNLDAGNVFFITKKLDFIRRSEKSKTGNKNIVERFSQYLQARIAICDFLLSKSPEICRAYFPYIYRHSLKYIRILIFYHRFRLLISFSKRIRKFSHRKYFCFIGGVILYAVSGKIFLLKKV